MTLADVIAWLERKEREMLSVIPTSGEDFGRYPAAESHVRARAAEFAVAAEALREVRQMICREE